MSSDAAATALAGYEASCPSCTEPKWMSTTDFTRFAGAGLKDAIDRGEKRVPELVMAYTGKKAGDAGVHVANEESALPGLVCSSCQNRIPIVEFVRKQFQEDSLPASVQIASLMREEGRVTEREVTEELDPWVRALYRVRKTHPDVNPYHPEIGTARLSHTLRFLLAPFFSFLRVVVFRDCEQFFVGSVSVFRPPPAAQGKRPSSGAWTGGWRGLRDRLLPMTLSADAPICVLPFTLVVLIVLTSLLFTHYHVLGDDDDAQGRYAVTSAESFVRLMSLLVFGLASGAMWYMFRTIITDPGYLLPHPSSGLDSRFLDELKDGDVVNSPAANGADTDKNKSLKDALDPRLMLGASDSGASPLSEESTTCRYCRIRRPPRAAHSKIAGICLHRFDHKCVAIGADIGLRNHAIFYSFLVVGCMGGVAACAQIVLFVIVASHKITNAGWVVGCLGLLFSGLGAMWTFGMWSTQVRAIRAGRTVLENIRDGLANAGVPKPQIGDAEGKANAKAFFEAPIPPSVFECSVDEVPGVEVVV